MRSRTFILFILVLIALGVVIVLAFAGGGLTALLGGGQDGTAAVTEGEDSVTPEGSQPPGPVPTATPEPPQFVSVVIAKVDIPVGQIIRSDLIEVEERPANNVALQGQYTFSSVDDSQLLGQIVKVNIPRGEAILRPMLAINPTDIAAFGSDLGLYVDRGKVAVAFPINELTGAAFAMRPGDYVDVMMSLSLVELDQEFHTPLSNLTARVDETALLEGREFVFEPILQGRLQLIEELELVAEIVPGSKDGTSSADIEQLPRRVTQLTIQQAEVLWVGTWRDPRELEKAQEAAAEAAVVGTGTGPLPTPTPLPQRFETRPDVVILSMPAQDALALKWALEVGIRITLALRAPGDFTVYTTTSVSLPQLVEQGGVVVPQPGQFGLEPSVDDVKPPSLPANPPQN